MNHKSVVRLKRDPRRNRKPARRFVKPKASLSNRSSSGKGIPMALMWLVLIALAGYLVLDRADSVDPLVAVASTPIGDSHSASFALCGGSTRKNCVVDGDTFWFNGEKIRIADIDTPELSPSRCETERVIGEAAKARLLALLNAGHFALSAGFRDEDKYGRKLRTVTRDGQSVGAILVAEGLARTWDGARRGWCD